MSVVISTALTWLTLWNSNCCTTWYVHTPVLHYKGQYLEKVDLIFMSILKELGYKAATNKIDTSSVSKTSTVKRHLQFSSIYLYCAITSAIRSLAFFGRYVYLTTNNVIYRNMIIIINLN